MPVCGRTTDVPCADMDTTAVPGREARLVKADDAVKTTNADPAVGAIPATGARAVTLIDATPAFAMVVPGTLAWSAVKMIELALGSAARDADGARAVREAVAVPGRAPMAAVGLSAVRVMELVPGSADRAAETL